MAQKKRRPEHCRNTTDTGNTAKTLARALPHQVATIMLENPKNIRIPAVTKKGAYGGVNTSDSDTGRSIRQERRHMSAAKAFSVGKASGCHMKTKKLCI